MNEAAKQAHPARGSLTGLEYVIANFKLEHEDLNECVAQLLKKSKDDLLAGGRDVKRRQRKN